MYSQKRQKGNVAEDAVILHLKNTGFQILDQNYLKKWGEIDIVAKRSRKIHFIEVKSSVLRKFDGFLENENKKDWDIIVSHETESDSVKTNSIVFNPVWNMTNKKKVKFSKIIRTYLADKYYETMPDFQVDLFSVLLDFYQKKAYINRIDNITLETS